MSKERGNMSQESGSISPQCFHKDIAYCDVQFGEIVGNGTFGIVHKAIWNGIQVAVKVMEGEEATKALDKEVHQLSKLRHENIVRLYGVCLKPKVCLIMEYAENGSLYDILHPKDQYTKPCDYTIGHVVSWALQCARAMEYLHGLTPTPIVHRDLKPPNMLLKEHGTVLKICDFGTARPQDTSHMTSNKGSAAWMAPEVFAGPTYSEKCDIFSFGIVLWEMITRRKPFDDIGPPPFRIMWAVHHGTRPPLVRGIPKIFEQLMVSAWDKNTEIRPPFSAIVLFFEKASQFVSGGNTPLTIPVAKRSSGEYDSYSESSSYCDTAKEQNSLSGSAGKVSIAGKDKVMYTVSSAEQSPVLSEYDKISINSPGSGSRTVDSPDPSRRSPFSPVRTFENEGIYAGYTDVPKQGLGSPGAPAFNYQSHNSSDVNDISEQSAVQFASPTAYGNNQTNPNFFKKHDYAGEGIGPPPFRYGSYPVRPNVFPRFELSPNHTGIDSLQFPSQLPYPRTHTPPSHGLATPSPGSTYDLQSWIRLRCPRPILEHSSVGDLGDRFQVVNINDLRGNDNVFVPNAPAPNYPGGRSSHEISSLESNRSSGTPSPLNSSFTSPSASEMDLELRIQRSRLPPGPQGAIPHSVSESHYEENLWHLIDPEIAPLTPIQGSKESIEIYESHSKLIYEYIKLQRDFEYLLQRKREITKQLDDERREQQRSSIYLEEYLNLLEERQSLSAYLGTLRHELQQASSCRGSGENLL